MKEFVGFVKGFLAGIGILLATLTAVVGWIMGLFTAAMLDESEGRKKPDYGATSRRTYGK